MTATQTQIRRDSDTNLTAATPALGELGYNTTKKRIHAGDGTTPGGIILPNAFDMQNMSFNAVNDTGVADAIALSIAPAPAAYSAYQTFVFKAAATNATTTPTITVNSLAAVTCKKVTSSGVAAMAAGDIQAGAIYRAVYDGTYFQIENIASAGGAGGETVLLGTATAASSATLDFTSLISSSYAKYSFVFKDIVLPGTGSPSLNILLSSNNGSTWSVGIAALGYLQVNLPSGATLGGRTLTSSGMVIWSKYSGTMCGYGELIVGSAGPARGAFRTGDFYGGIAYGNYTDLQTNATGVNAVRFAASAGTLSSGTIYMYGVKNT